jgi:hypothetical protein
MRRTVSHASTAYRALNVSSRGQLVDLKYVRRFQHVETGGLGHAKHQQLFRSAQADIARLLDLDSVAMSPDIENGLGWDTQGQSDIPVRV